MAAVRPKLYIRLGTHSEKDYLIKTIKYLDGFMIAANLLEATPGATASLIVKLAGTKIAKPYFLDPMTYAYGLDLDFLKSEQTVKVKGRKRKVFKIKRSYKQLAEQFDGVFAEAVERDEPLGPDDFSSDEVTSETCQAVADYQLHRPGAELASDEEFAVYAPQIPDPAGVIAPYFYIDDDAPDEWLDLFFKLAQSTVELELNTPVYAVLCADESFVNDSTVTDRVIEELPQTRVDGVWLWFSNFNEHSATRRQLRNLRDLVSALSEKISVYNMHGGYFSLALSRLGMSGFAHGVGYGEQKDIAPVQGQSTPTVRYYLPDVRKRLGVPEIERTFSRLEITSIDDFFEKICGCVVCRGVLTSSLRQFSSFGELHYASADSRRMSQTAAAAKLCRFHFLLNRIKERDAVAGQTLDEIRGNLRSCSRTWSRQPTIANDADHLPRWRKALSETDDEDVV